MITNAVLQIAAFVNQINLKNVTVFFTNAFKRKAALNKERSFLHFALVILLGVSGAVMSAIAVGLGFYIYYDLQKKKNYLHAVTSSVLRNSKGIPHSSSLEDSENFFSELEVHFFTYSELEDATNFFDPDRELGDVGFGKVEGFGKVYFSKT